MAVTRLTKDWLTEWIRSNKRYWHWSRSHQAAHCNLRKPCSLCQGKHLQVLWEVNDRSPKEPPAASEVVSHAARATTEALYRNRHTESCKVLLKVVKVCIHYSSQTLYTYAILDNGSERIMLLPNALEKLQGMQGPPEALLLCTITQEVQTLTPTP